MKLFDWDRFWSDGPTVSKIIFLLVLGSIGFMVLAGTISILESSGMLRFVLCALIVYVAYRAIKNVWNEGYFFPDGKDD